MWLMGKNKYEMSFEGQFKKENCQKKSLDGKLKKENHHKTFTWWVEVPIKFNAAYKNVFFSFLKLIFGIVFYD